MQRAVHDARRSATPPARSRRSSRCRPTSPRSGSCSRSSPRSACSSARSRTASRGCSPASTAASTWSTRASRRTGPERVKQGWEMVQRNVERIRSMVLDILYYAKDRELEVATIDVEQLAVEVVESLQKRASDVDVALSPRGRAARSARSPATPRRCGRCWSTSSRTRSTPAAPTRQERATGSRFAVRRVAAVDRSSRSRTTASAWTGRRARRSSPCSSPPRGSAGTGLGPVHLQQDRRQARRPHRRRLGAGARQPLRRPAAAGGAPSAPPDGREAAAGAS